VPPIEHVFVLMLENRSFDHMLGFSGITGTDPVTGKPTSLAGLTGDESNAYAGVSYPVTEGADWSMPRDPNHELQDTVVQLCGPAKRFVKGQPYPPIDNSGFVVEWAAAGGFAQPGEIMKCYAADQLPVLNALAREFAVCDGWHSSMPGPTWPNRFFAMAGSSGGLDRSPDPSQMADWYTGMQTPDALGVAASPAAGLASLTLKNLMSPPGFQFANGSIFDALTRKGTPWQVYYGDEGPYVGRFPIAGALANVHVTEWSGYSRFASDLAAGRTYPFTWIEPNYGSASDNTYFGGTSQHPMDDVTKGEGLIKSVYETIRASPVWEKSLLIITWDEHGGFYDHVAPGPAVEPGDPISTSFGTINQFGFTFDRLGVRVPAVVVSPLIAQNVVDHRPYEHASIPATVERLCGMPALTARDAAAADVLSLLTLSAPRATPETLPNPADSGLPQTPVETAAGGAATAAGAQPLGPSNLAGFVQVAARADTQLSPPAEHPAIQEQVAAIETRGQATDYIKGVAEKLAETT